MREWFEAGGIEPVYDGEAATPEDAVARLKASGAELACLCSDDKTYAARAAEFAAAVKAAGVEGPHARRASRRPRGGACARPASTNSFSWAATPIAALKGLYKRVAP